MLKFALALTVLAASVSASTDRVVCYYGSWSVYRAGNGKFDVENLDPNLCTHIIYSFVGLNSDGTIRILDTLNEVDRAALTRFAGLRSQNPQLKSLLAVGGWNEGSTKYSAMVSSASLRATFIRSAVQVIQTYGFDGFDLDWEYPSQRGGASTDKNNFSTLLQEMRSEFDKYGYLLTAAVVASGSSVDISYDVPKLSQYLDFINVMTYDIHGSWEYATGQNAPLYASSRDTTTAQKQLNIDSCIRGWISRGAAPAKLNLGIGTYGRTYTLSSTSNTGLGAAAVGPGTAGQYTGEAGYLGYNEICEYVKTGTWTVVWDNEQKVPYMYKGNQWVGYDNEISVAFKVDYAKSLGLGGIMIWSLETDDFRGTCGSKNPLLTQINNSLGSSGSAATTTTAATTTAKTTTAATATAATTSATTAAPSDTGSVCKATGYMRDSTNCGTFYYCAGDGNGGYVQTTFNCPTGLYYDLNLSVCNYANNVAC